MSAKIVEFQKMLMSLQIYEKFAEITLKLKKWRKNS